MTRNLTPKKGQAGAIIWDKGQQLEVELRGNHIEDVLDTIEYKLFGRKKKEV